MALDECLQAIKGSEKGEPAALLISASSTIPIAGTDFSRSPSGSSFTIFLTAPLQAFCLLLGILGSENEMVRKNLPFCIFTVIGNFFGLLLCLDGGNFSSGYLYRG